MKVYELLTFNRELLRRIHRAGLRADDYRYVQLYGEYRELLASGEKVTWIVATLSTRHNVSERHVYSVIGKLSREIAEEDLQPQSR